MALACAIYKNGLKLGTGSASDGSASITSFTRIGNAVVARRNLQFTITEAGVHAGRTWAARVLNDDGAGTLTLSQACPFVE